MRIAKLSLQVALCWTLVLGTGVVVMGAAPAPAPGPGPGAAANPGAAAATQPATQPGGRGRGRGARGPAITVVPPADAVQVELAPPLDKNGNFKHSPKTSWMDVPAIEVKPDVPRGTVTTFQMRSEDSKFYPGRAGPYVRGVWVYVPAGYTPGTELPFMVDHDGRANAVIQTELIKTLDILIHEKKIPMMAGVFIANGGDGQPSERSLEYDTPSGKYAEFIEAEVLPLAEKSGNVKLTKDPDGRGVIGQSSGSAAALAMAWYHPEMYRRVISYSGTFVRIQTSPDAPNGAWDYHQTLIPKSEKKPLRIWMQVGSRDNGATESEAGLRNWPLANNYMAKALTDKGYEYQYLWSENAGHVERGVERQTIMQAMEWVWKTYKAK